MLRIGTISPPGWASFCGAEMQAAAAAPIEVIDRPMRLGEGFAFGVEEIRRAAGAIEAAACDLAGRSVDAILQIGGPFAILHGAAGARAIEARIARKAGVPFEMMALSMLRTLERSAARDVMICSAYYPEQWNAALVDFVAESGAHVIGRRSFAEIGLSAAQDAAAMAAGFEDIGPHDVIKALSACAEPARASALYLTGLPCPLLAHSETLRKASPGPVITYLDSYASLFERIGILPGASLAGGR